MATISINGRIYHNIYLIAFDKDGTLVDFHHLWGGRVRNWLNWLARNGAGDDHRRQKLHLALCHSLGFDPKTNRIIHDSPLAVASMPKIYTIAAGVLFQQGLDWLEAEQLVVDSQAENISLPPAAHEIQPIGNVLQALQQLAAAGVHIAVVTSDDRAFTAATLPILEIENIVSCLACGDDDLPNKPAPDALLALGQQFNLNPAQMLMVGDTASDMIFGRNAAVAGCIGVRGGAGNPQTLSRYADQIIHSIEEIQVINE